MKCPRCQATLTAEEVKTLWGAYTTSQRKTKAGGRKGGRPKGTGKKRTDPPTKGT